MKLLGIDYKHPHQLRTLMKKIITPIFIAILFFREIIYFLAESIDRAASASVGQKDGDDRISHYSDSVPEGT